MLAKQYASAESYEAKLEKVMSRLGVEKYNYNWDRFSCWIEFFYKGNLYRFEHSIENAKNHGNNVKYGSDVFAQVVLGAPIAKPCNYVEQICRRYTPQKER